MKPNKTYETTAFVLNLRTQLKNNPMAGLTHTPVEVFYSTAFDNLAVAVKGIIWGITSNLFMDFQLFAKQNPELYGGWTPLPLRTSLHILEVEMAEEKDAIRVFYKPVPAVNSQSVYRDAVLLLPREFIEDPESYKKHRYQQIQHKKLEACTVQAPSKEKAIIALHTRINECFDEVYECIDELRDQLLP